MTKDSLDAAFSLLPRSSADYAVKRVLDRSRQPVAQDAFEIRWAEFDFAGHFLRGGISDISDLASVIVSNSQSDPSISLLARRAVEGNLRAGLIEWIDDRERFMWFLPYRHLDANGHPETRLRGLVITASLFGEIMELFNGDANLTFAEKRTVFQLVGGLDLRDAARDDRVSYETKRAHTKTASQKLGCTGQKDLVRIAMGQMVHLMSVSDTELRQDDPAVQLAETYLYDDMQLVIRHHRSGATLRYLVGGPAGGTPVVMVHGMMLPIILRGVSRFLERNNLRLYVPIRTGYLESRARGALFEQRDVLEQGIREIAYVIEEEGLAPVTLVGNSLGGGPALRLALKHPELFSRLILMSPNLALAANDNGPDSGAFYSGMHELKSNAFLFKLVNLEYRKFYSDSETCRYILRKHFSRSATDLDVLEGRYTGHDAYRMFASTYQSSIVGIAEDFRSMMTGSRVDSQSLRIPLSVVHGDADPLTSYTEIQEEFRAPLRGVERLIAGAGHFAPASHGNEAWGAVAEACNL